jgi:hypothetical protein
MEAGDVMLALPDRRTCIGVTIRGVVTASTSQGSLIFASASGINTTILCSVCLSDNGVTEIFTGSGALTVPNIHAGSTFTIFCTGLKWVITAKASSTNPTRDPGFNPQYVTLEPTSPVTPPSITVSTLDPAIVVFRQQFGPILLPPQPLFTLI